jgi:glycosyltransferase involved in cell wall biosynthesis
VTPGKPAAASLLVDARALRASGVGRYLREILAPILAAPPFDRITLFGNPAELDAFMEVNPSRARVEVVPHHGGTYSLRSQASWARLRLMGRASGDVAFFPHWDAPMLLPRRRSVVTVHDVTHFRVPDAFPPLRRMAARAVFQRVVSRATRIIVVSDWTRRDLLELEPGAEEKTRVVPNGVGREFRPPQPDEPLGQPVREPFLLCVGNKKRHKNLTAAIGVLVQLLPQYPHLQLVVAGQVGAGWDEVLAAADEKGVRAAVVDLPVVGDGQLRVLYGRCAAFLFPSRYEGFGLPVLEAMACGAPVVASNASSIPEVAGQAALLFDPDDVDGMASAVSRLLIDPAFRATLVRLGRERAATFAWDRAARQTVEILQGVATG